MMMWAAAEQLWRAPSPLTPCTTNSAPQCAQAHRQSRACLRVQNSDELPPAMAEMQARAAAANRQRDEEKERVRTAFTAHGLGEHPLDKPPNPYLMRDLPKVRRARLPQRCSVCAGCWELCVWGVQVFGFAAVTAVFLSALGRAF